VQTIDAATATTATTTTITTNRGKPGAKPRKAVFAEKYENVELLSNKNLLVPPYCPRFLLLPPFSILHTFVELGRDVATSSTRTKIFVWLSFLSLTRCLLIVIVSRLASMQGRVA
jgi:hypothetical protein